MRVQPHFPSRPLTAIVTSSSGAAFLACSAANSPAPPAPRMRISVERVGRALIRHPPSPQGRADSRDRASGVGPAAKRLPAPARGRGADVAVAAVPHPARAAPESALPRGEGGVPPPSRLDVLAPEAAGVLGEAGVGGVALRLAVRPELEVLLPGSIGAEA